MAYGGADIDTMLAGPLGVPIVFGTVTARALLDEASVLGIDEEGLSLGDRATVALVKTGALAGVTVGSSVTVDSRAFTVRSVDLIDDGAMQALIVVAA